MLKLIILPRQARDKRRENSEQRRVDVRATRAAYIAEVRRVPSVAFLMSFFLSLSCRYVRPEPVLATNFQMTFGQNVSS
jgi:hypothetical protein